MTKAEELKLLDKIAGLIAESGKDSYISMTFAGIVDVCKRNIELDFGDSPVQDLAIERERLSAEVVSHDETKHQLSDAQKMCKEALDENERLQKLADEWEQNAHDAGEMYTELEQENTVLTAEIRKLKAEIVRMRMERMDESAIAELYEKM